MPGGTDFFAGREEVLESLRAQLTPGNGRAAVLCGLGGIGKTQTAIEYVKRNHENYEIVLWCLADSEASLVSGFAAFAPDLGLPEKNDVPELVKDVKRWLERNENWLLILDNADDPTLAKTFIPAHHKGGVLLTSVAYSFRVLGVVKPERLGVFTESESLEFFRECFGGKESDKDFSQDERTELINLAEVLGFFPLALEQAVAYLIETGTPVSTYIADLGKQTLLPVLEKGKVTATPDYKKTVATTWQAAFEIIERDYPVSAEVLRLSAFLAPDKIPAELFEGLVPTGDTLNDIIAPLMRFSLVKFDGENQSFSLHRLIQEATKSRLCEDVKRALIKQVVKLVYERFPEVRFENWPICRLLLPHAQSCARLILKLDIEDESSGVLLNQIAYFFYIQYQFSEAEPLFERALRILERVLGAEHPDTAGLLNNLATLYESQGRYAEAESLYERALGICERVLGAEHPDTAQSLNNLAALYFSQGRDAKAESLYERALGICERVLGAEHPDTATSLNNLAALYFSQGRNAKAEPLYQRALGICERVLGIEHPDTATSLNNLAALYESQGRYLEAEPLYEKAWGIRERTLGTEHPDTVQSLNLLAALYESQGRYLEAEPLYEKALGGRKRTLGIEHLDTVRSPAVSVSYRSQERYRQTEPLQERALQIEGQALGVGHPNPAKALNNLGLLYYSLRRYLAAESLYNRALEIQERMLGADHPDTDLTINNLANLFFSQGRYSEAESLFERTLKFKQKTLGEGHLKTKKIVENLDFLRRKMKSDHTNK